MKQVKYQKAGYVIHCLSTSTVLLNAGYFGANTVSRKAKVFRSIRTAIVRQEAERRKMECKFRPGVSIDWIDTKGRVHNLHDAIAAGIVK